MKTLTPVIVVLLGCASLAHGQAGVPSPAPTPGAPGMQRRYPPPPVIDSTPHAITVKGAPKRLGSSSSAGSESLRAWRASSLSRGRGLITIAGTTREVAAGQVLEGYTIHSIEPHRVVLTRPIEAAVGGAGGTEMAVLTFGQAGGTRVLRIFDVDPTPRPLAAR